MALKTAQIGDIAIELSTFRNTKKRGYTVSMSRVAGNEKLLTALAFRTSLEEAETMYERMIKLLKKREEEKGT